MQDVWDRWLLESQLVETRTSGSQGHPFSLPLSLPLPSSPFWGPDHLPEQLSRLNCQQEGGQESGLGLCRPPAQQQHMLWWLNQSWCPISASQNAASIFSQYKIPKLAGSQKRNRLEDIYIFLLADWEKTELPVWLQKGNTPQRKQHCNFTVPRKGTSATGAVLQGKAVSTKDSSHTSFVGSCLCKFPGSSGNFTAIKTTFFCL